MLPQLRHAHDDVSTLACVPDGAIVWQWNLCASALCIIMKGSWLPKRCCFVWQPVGPAPVPVSLLCRVGVPCLVSELFGQV